MDHENRQKKGKKARRAIPPLPNVPASHPSLKKEKTYHGNYADEGIDGNQRYLDETNKSKSLEQFSKKAEIKRKNYSDFENNNYDEIENQAGSDNENQNEIISNNNSDHLFNFEDFDTGKRPDAFYDEGDHDPIFEKVRIHLNAQLFNPPKVSLRSNSAPFNNKIIQPIKEENTLKSINKRQSDAVLEIHNHQNQLKFSSDENSEPKTKKKTKKKSRKSANIKKKSHLTGSDGE